MVLALFNVRLLPAEVESVIVAFPIFTTPSTTILPTPVSESARLVALTLPSVNVPAVDVKRLTVVYVISFEI